MYLYKLYLHLAKEILCDFRSVYSGEEYFVEALTREILLGSKFCEKRFI